MSICFNKEKGVFLLNTPSSTYVIRVYNEKYLLHGGWFHSLPVWSDVCVMPLADRSFCPVPSELHGSADFSLDAQQCEFPVPMRSDFRSSAFEAVCDDNLATDLEYKSYRIFAGKKSLDGLPSTYVSDDSEADTLEIDLKDPNTGLLVTLSYTVWKSLDVICRHAVFKCGSKPLSLRKALSASIDFPHSRYKMMQLSGAHARERHVILRNLVPGMQGIESRRGMSSHQQNPFLALLSDKTGESNGEAFGFNLVYSGNFLAQIEVDQWGMARLQMGINPFNFDWKLKDGEEFCTPEVVMVRSESGIGGMSRTFHDLYRKNLCRGKWRDAERPVVINNWEATYFNFDVKKLFSLADTAAKEGVELFVLDDGWFGKRNDDRSSLGDWIVNKGKLPNGLEEVSDGIHKRGMKFGLWFEPEMISPDSDLYRSHPDWAFHVEGRNPVLGRHQLVLNLGKEEVVDYLLERLSDILSTAHIDYVKWDFNRSVSDMYLNASHKFYLGLYRLLGILTSRFPEVLFESCSGGGGRFDAGILYYMPQTWTSDNTDALSRIPIQMGTSLVYPASAMSCHVSAVPNHQVGRLTSLSSRGHVAMAGTFGYELDLNLLSELELAEIKSQIAWYKKIRGTVQFGDLYRIECPWNYTAAAESSRYSAWEHVSKDKKQAVVTIVWQYAEANPEYINVPLQGLDPDAKYCFKSLQSETLQDHLKKSVFDMPANLSCIVPDGTCASGAELMYAGLRVMGKPQYGGSVHFLLEKC
ncbi:MAG: alpha-galactosidase [Treponema sp.]|nr:alpha-galactosidase [Treponema sp.]